MAVLAFGAAHAADPGIKGIIQAENELGRISASNVGEPRNSENYWCSRWEKLLALDFPRAEDSVPR